MSSPGMPKVGDVVADKYEIEAVVGEGGMGTVYAATHKLTGKRLALKWMLPELAQDPGAVQRFMREAQAAGRIDHPNVVDIYDVGEHEGTPFIVMEYLYGESLTAAIERNDTGWQQMVQLLLPALRGVAAAHRRGVIHRDLKPDNIFLCRDADGNLREPKVLDFGISKVSSSDGQANLRLTKTGAVVGTPYYMSPEQVRGASEVDPRSDVYAFGVILYEALTGQVPFDAENYSALILEIATGTPTRPSTIQPQLPPDLERVVMRAMSREPTTRYSTIEELAQALEPFAAGVTFGSERRDPTGAQQLSVTSAATPFSSTMPAGRRSVGLRSPLALVFGTAGLVVLGGAIGLLILAQRNGAEPDPASVEAERAAAGSSAAVAAAVEDDSEQPPAGEAPSDEATETEAVAEAQPEPEQVAEASEEGPPDAGVERAAAQRAQQRRDARAQERRGSRAHDAERRRARRKAERDAERSAQADQREEQPRPRRRVGRTGSLAVDEF